MVRKIKCQCGKFLKWNKDKNQYECIKISQKEKKDGCGYVLTPQGEQPDFVPADEYE